MYEKIFALKMTERMTRVRERIVRHPVAVAGDVYKNEFYPLYYSGDRWLTRPLLEGWIKGSSQLTTLKRRAFAESYALDHAEAVIYPEELLLGQLDIPELTEEEHRDFFAAAEEFRKYSPTLYGRGRCCHISLDFPKLLRCGVLGLLEEIRTNREKLRFDESAVIQQSFEKKEFYDCCEMELEALLRFAAKYAAKARQLAESESDGSIAANYLDAAEILEHVPARPARTFRDALQSIHFYVFNLFGLYPTGRMDEYLYPYYKRDMEGGILTLELAQELVDNFCLLMSTYVFSRAANSMVLAGKDTAGNPVGNALTAHFLRSIEHVRRPDPNFAYAVTADPDPELFSFAVQNVLTGTTQPSFYNDEGITRAIVRLGVPAEDARLYTNTTCSEITICGKTRALTTCPFINTLNILREILHSKEEFSSVEDIFNAFEALLNRKMDIWIRNINEVMLERSRIGAEPFRVSCLVEDCIDRGRSIWSGGAVYNVIEPSFFGVTNTAESISTYDHLVFRGKELSQEQLTDIVDQNFEGYEPLRQRIIHKLPHYGNADDEADFYMRKLTDILQNVCKNRLNLWGGPVVPGAFPYMVHSTPEACRYPSADGRKAGDTLASCPGPLNGYDRHGPTASLYSSSSWPQADFLGGITMNIRFQKTIADAAGADRVGSLIRGFFARGGKQLQINILNADELKDAIAHPEKYNDLIVRIGGYSEYFNRLSDTLKKDVIQRTELSVRGAL